MDGFLNTVFGGKDIKDSHSHYALLLECLEDKEEIMEEGLENPFIERKFQRLIIKKRKTYSIFGYKYIIN